MSILLLQNKKVGASISRTPTSEVRKYFFLLSLPVPNLRQKCTFIRRHRHPNQPRLVPRLIPSDGEPSLFRVGVCLSGPRKSQMPSSRV